MQSLKKKKNSRNLEKVIRIEQVNDYLQKILNGIAPKRVAFKMILRSSTYICHIY